MLQKEISVPFEELIDFHLPLTQTRPSVRGQRGYIFILFFLGPNGAEFLATEMIFSALILPLWHMFFVNQLLFKKAQVERAKSVVCPFLPLCHQDTLYTLFVLSPFYSSTVAGEQVLFLLIFIDPC